MKPVLYIGAALMIAAGIYGFVDYNKKSHSKEFQSLYTKEEKQEEPIPPAPTGIPEIMAADIPATVKDTVADTKQVAVVSHKKPARKKTERFNLSLYSRARPVKFIKEEEEEVAVDTVVVEEPAVVTEP